jgi:hypothetical protein
LIITTTDPITGELLHYPDSKPYVVEGKGNLAVKIYFESEETRRVYLLTHDSSVKTMGHYSHQVLIVLPHSLSGATCQKSNTT